jgi:hypothetical protein
MEFSMISPKMVNGIFKRNLKVIKRQIDGLSDDDALMQVPFRGNCLNWVLGHILDSRQAALRYLDIPGNVDENIDTLYGGDSAPITPQSKNIPPMSQIMTILNETEKLIDEKINSLTEEDMEKEVGSGDRKALLGEKMEFLAWHEGYHVGQTEYLRQLTGTDDKVI